MTTDDTADRQRRFDEQRRFENKQRRLAAALRANLRRRKGAGQPAADDAAPASQAGQPRPDNEG